MITRFQLLTIIQKVDKIAISKQSKAKEYDELNNTASVDDEGRSSLGSLNGEETKAEEFGVRRRNATGRSSDSNPELETD